MKPLYPKCDIILTQEEYELIMKHRAFKRLMAEWTERQRRENIRKRLGR